MRIAVTGTRGFPNVQGGIEKHCEKLYPRLVELGCDVTVFTRTPYVDCLVTGYQGVKFIDLNCMRNKHFEAIFHTFRSIWNARRIKPDILHIHGIGPSLLTPMARMFGMKVVVTNHGQDYNRQKWGPRSKLILRLGERMGSMFSNGIICITDEIAAHIREKYGRDPFVIPNGVELHAPVAETDILREYGLDKDRYVLAVGRYVPEKGFTDLINAFAKASLDGWKLVIAGDADHETKYSRRIKEEAAKRPDIVLTGALPGDKLCQVMSHAGMFALPSYHEGLPIALLEAMCHGLLCVASDIGPNRCVKLPEEKYFPAGDIDALAEKLKYFAKNPISDSRRREQIEQMRRDYDWEVIARMTKAVYEKVLA